MTSCLLATALLGQHEIRVGYELVYDCPQQTPMVLMLNIHHTRAGDILVPDRMVAEPFVPMTSYRDGFGNWCTRILRRQAGCGCQPVRC